MKLTPKYASLLDFMAVYNLTLPRNEDWRLTDRIVGNIHALPDTHGVLVATNGILCYIERESDLFLGHIAFFIPQSNIYKTTITKLCKQPSTLVSKRQLIDDLI